MAEFSEIQQVLIRSHRRVLDMLRERHTESLAEHLVKLTTCLNAEGIVFSGDEYISYKEVALGPDEEQAE